MENKKLNFCTLFNSHYLTRGLAMYFSLVKYCQNFHLYIIAFDDKCYEILRSLDLPYLTIISLSEFEDPELLRIKPTRNEKEYCWTCSSSTIWYCINKYNLDMCIYIDADMLFFSDPQAIIDEMKDSSILLTEHRLSEKGSKIEQNGKYCVQFMPFKQDEDGMRALAWWRDRCIEWCYDRFEDGKLGDQKYLNDWTERFSGVQVMEHIGGGVAPWNMFRYEISSTQERLGVIEKETGKKAPLVFYHFQSTKIFNLFGTIKTTYWPYDFRLSRAAEKIYTTYDTAIVEAWKKIREVEPRFRLGFATLSEYCRFMFRRLKINIIHTGVYLKRTMLPK